MMMDTKLECPKVSLGTNFVETHTTICLHIHNIGVPGSHKDIQGLQMRYITSFLLYLGLGGSMVGVQVPEHNNKPPFCPDFLS